MLCKVFPCLGIRGDQDRSCWIRRPLFPIRPLTCPMVSRWLTEVPVKFHYGVVAFGVVSLSLPLVFVKLAYVGAINLFVWCSRSVKFMAKISLSYSSITWSKLIYSQKRKKASGIFYINFIIWGNSSSLVELWIWPQFYKFNAPNLHMKLLFLNFNYSM